MEFDEAYKTVHQILKGHRAGRCNIPEAVQLLEAFYLGQPPTAQKHVLDILEVFLTNERLVPAGPNAPEPRTAHRALIRAITSFGPLSSLPEIVFELLPSEGEEAVASWALHVVGELVFCLANYGERFDQATLDRLKGQARDHARHADAHVGETLAPGVRKAMASLLDAVEMIEFRRFAASITAARPQAGGLPTSSEGHPEDSEIPANIIEAAAKAKGYLESDGPFDPKIAADLIRTCMDEAHRFLVGEVAKLTGVAYTARDKDGERRAYLQQRGLISPPEEKFFSCVYSLISEEASHRLLAERETVLVLETTVHSYLRLLFRRLSQLQSSSGFGQGAAP